MSGRQKSVLRAGCWPRGEGHEARLAVVLQARPFVISWPFLSVPTALVPTVGPPGSSPRGRRPGRPVRGPGPACGSCAQGSGRGRGSGCQFCRPVCPQGDAFSKVTLLHGWIEDSKYWPDGRKSYVTHKEEMILLFSRGETLYSRGLKELSREAAVGPAACDSGLSADFSELVAAASLEQSRGERCLAPAWGGGGDALGPARRDSAGLPAPGAQARDSQFPGAASHVLPRSFWRVVI